MRDVLRFLIRGAWGGAIFPWLMLTIFYGPLYGSLIFFSWITWYLVPGAIVGAILWVLSQRLASIKPLLRMSIGTLVALAVLVYLNRDDLARSHLNQLDLTAIDKVYGLFRTLIFSAGIGGVSGLLCPTKKLINAVPPLPYWERVHLYEAAELEARQAGMRRST